jgi:hypothetical protein
VWRASKNFYLFWNHHSTKIQPQFTVITAIILIEQVNTFTMEKSKLFTCILLNYSSSYDTMFLSVSQRRGWTRSNHCVCINNFLYLSKSQSYYNLEWMSLISPDAFSFW